MSEASVIRRERTELYVGLFIVVGLAIMGGLIWQFGSFTDKLKARYQLQIVLEDATGIIIGAEVRFGGTPIGLVTNKEIKKDFSSMLLTLEIFEQYKIPEGSKLSLATSGLMGDRYINIVPPEEVTDQTIKAGTTIDGGGVDVLAEVTERAARLSDKMEVVLGELDQAIKETRVVVNNLTSVTEKFDQRVMSEENLDNIGETIEKMKVTTSNLANGSAKLEPLLEESRETVAAARKPFERATEVIDKIEPAVAELQPALAEVRPTLIEFKDTAAKANYAIDRILEGDGVAGALISDPELKADLESFVENLEEHGILGYKSGKRRSDAEEEKAEEKTGDTPPAPRKKGLFNFGN